MKNNYLTSKDFQIAKSQVIEKIYNPELMKGRGKGNFNISSLHKYIGKEVKGGKTIYHYKTKSGKSIKTDLNPSDTLSQDKVDNEELKKLAKEHKLLDVLAHNFDITDDEVRVTVTKTSYSQLSDTRKFLQENGFNLKGGEISSEAGPDYQVLIYK